MNTKLLMILTVTIMSVSLIQYSNAAVDLDPLILKQPESFTKTIETSTWLYDFRTTSILAIDDSGTSLTTTCVIEKVNHSYKSGTRIKWNLPPGEHTVYCEVQDKTGNTSSANWTITIIRDVLAPSWVKTVAGWYASSNLIDQDMYLKILKYFHTAGVIEFDIYADSPINDPKPPLSFKTDTKNWTQNRISNQVYKNVLETMADKGVFEKINI